MLIKDFRGTGGFDKKKRICWIYRGMWIRYVEFVGKGGLG